MPFHLHIILDHPLDKQNKEPTFKYHFIQIGVFSFIYIYISIFIYVYSYMCVCVFINFLLLSLC